MAERAITLSSTYQIQTEWPLMRSFPFLALPCLAFARGSSGLRCWYQCSSRLLVLAVSYEVRSRRKWKVFATPLVCSVLTGPVVKGEKKQLVCQQQNFTLKKRRKLAQLGLSPMRGGCRREEGEKMNLLVQNPTLTSCLAITYLVSLYAAHSDSIKFSNCSCCRVGTKSL